MYTEEQLERRKQISDTEMATLKSLQELVSVVQHLIDQDKAQTQLEKFAGTLKTIAEATATIKAK